MSYSAASHQVKSAQEEIVRVFMRRPHVALLGAGASRAAFPYGDRDGRYLPLMNDFERIPDVRRLLESARVPLKGLNFEDVYSAIEADSGSRDLCAALEGAVFDYFRSLTLPALPTIYDHLIVSLRQKDVIATFNWDPFLIQAISRHHYIADKPRLLFLHGNVLHGYCVRDDVHGVRGQHCSRCGEPFAPSRLLFPVTEKNYEKDPPIRASWEALRDSLRNCFMVSIFGYGAPKSDKSAIELLKEAWSGADERSLEQTEIIDIRPEVELAEQWSPFIHSHHYEIHADFYNSWIAKHPRRTGEAYWDQYLEAKFIEDNPILKEGTLDQLKAWLKPLLEAERQSESSIR